MRIYFWLYFLLPVGRGKVRNKSVDIGPHTYKLSLLANYLLGYNLGDV